MTAWRGRMKEVEKDKTKAKGDRRQRAMRGFFGIFSGSLFCNEVVMWDEAVN